MIQKSALIIMKFNLSIGIHPKKAGAINETMTYIKSQYVHVGCSLVSFCGSGGAFISELHRSQIVRSVSTLSEQISHFHFKLIKS
jgi:hypothetical protein